MRSSGSTGFIPLPPWDWLLHWPVVHLLFFWAVARGNSWHFAGAGIGNAIRCKLGKHHFTLFMCIAVSVSSACLVYAGFLKLAELLFHISVQHEAGYICSMLFIIPGFPFITSGIDLAKLDMRSGLERLAYAIIVVMVAAVSAWLMALLLHLKPVDFLPLELSAAQRILFRLLASFCGVFGFSVMFNSPVRLAAAAAFIGALSNTLRLELVDLAGFPPAAAAFFGALTAGLLASLIKTRRQRRTQPHLPPDLPSRRAHPQGCGSGQSAGKGGTIPGAGAGRTHLAPCPFRAGRAVPAP